MVLDQEIKDMKKGSSDSMKIRFQKLAFFKIKFIRLYAKSINLLTKPKMKLVRIALMSYLLKSWAYTDPSSSNQDLIEDLIEDIKVNSKTNGSIVGYSKDFRQELKLSTLHGNFIQKDIKKNCFKCSPDSRHVDLYRKKWRLLRDYIFIIIAGFNYQVY